MLMREIWTGPWAGLPVAWSETDEFDEATYRENLARCCRAGVPGIYTGGTTGEFYAIERDEFHGISAATIEVCHAHDKPAMIGCTATSTRGAVRRAQIAAELGADAIQVALPFWLPVRDEEVVPFFREVSLASGGLPFSIYETTRAKRTLSLPLHEAVKNALPNYLMVKANAGTLGATPEGCRSLSEFVNVFVGEPLWKELGPLGAKGSCSAMIYWNPAFTLRFWDAVERADAETVARLDARIQPLFEFVHAEFGPRGFTDTAFDRMVGVACGFLKNGLRSQRPYPSATERDVEQFRNWCHQHLPELLAQEPT